MDSFTKVLIVIGAVAYWIAIGFSAVKAVRHFLGWFLNSTPPLGKFGPMVEGITMLSHRFLTKQGLEERNKFIKWFSISLSMAIIFILFAEFSKGNAT